MFAITTLLHGPVSQRVFSQHYKKLVLSNFRNKFKKGNNTAQYL